VYNSAGEKVRLLVHGARSVGDPGQGFGSSATAFLPGPGGGIQIGAGGALYPWTGDNDSAQNLGGGVYYVQLEAVDPFGHVETSTLPLQLLASDDGYTIRIFNSAGEEVRVIQAAANAGSAPTRLLADKASLALVPGGGNLVRFDLGNGATAGWDGTNALGQLVSSGVYEVQLVVSQAGTPKTVSHTSVTVLALPNALLGDSRLGPNPLHGSVGGSRLHLSLSGAAMLEIQIRVYNLAGELIAPVRIHAQADDLEIQLPSSLASGIYMVAVSAKAPWGAVDRKVFKLALQ
jgi:hypothetical protein